MRTHGISGVKATKKYILAYVKDRSNPQHLRYGLRDHWNIDAGKGQAIYYSDATADLGKQSHREKVKRESENKARGDQFLRAAIDQYHSKKYSGVVSIEGFRLCRYKHGIAVAISRSTGHKEARQMIQTEAIERGMKRVDTYKWFSESQAHTEKFVNRSAVDTGSSLAIWLDASGYLSIRSQLRHEFGSSGLPKNRFHQENVSGDAHLINIGIHPSRDSEFKEQIIDVKDLEKIGEIRTEELLYLDPEDFA